MPADSWNESFPRTERLANHPKLGRVVPEADQDDIRELLSQNYRIIYRAANDRIEVLSVIHGARDLAARKPVPWEID